MLCLSLCFSLISQAYSHGPGAWIEGQRVAAEAETHGHTHGPAAHNASDHDHQKAEVAEVADDQIANPFPPPSGRPSAGDLPDGIARDGLRRPPKPVAV